MIKMNTNRTYRLLSLLLAIMMIMGLSTFALAYEQSYFSIIDNHSAECCHDVDAAIDLGIIGNHSAGCCHDVDVAIGLGTYYSVYCEDGYAVVTPFNTGNRFCNIHGWGSLMVDRFVTAGLNSNGQERIVTTYFTVNGVPTSDLRVRQMQFREEGLINISAGTITQNNVEVRIDGVAIPRSSFVLSIVSCNLGTGIVHNHASIHIRNLSNYVTSNTRTIQVVIRNPANWNLTSGQTMLIDVWYTPTVTTAAALQNAINAAPANTPTTIRLASNFNLGNTLVVPANRNITLESDGAAVRTLTQRNTGQRHFVVFGNLTLGNNVTLAGGLTGATHFSAFSAQDDIAGSRDISAVQELIEMQDFIRGTDSFYNEVSSARSAVSEGVEFVEFYAVSEFAGIGEIEQIAPFAAAVQAGGIEVAPGGVLTMNAGSVLENNFWTFGGAVLLYGTGTAASTRATLNMNGGTIRFNIAMNGGAVFMHTNSRMNMTSGTLSMNDVFEDGGAVWVGSGSTASGQGFNMTGGSIINNFASIDGGGIFTVDYTRGYGNIFTGQNTIFSGNLARGWVTPPPVANRPAHVRSASASVAGYVLNNLDIIYMGHLG